MKAQHPPRIPRNSLAVTEYFRSLPQPWEAAVATTRRWWHQEASSCTVHHPPVPRDAEKRTTWTDSKVGTWRGICIQVKKVKTTDQLLSEVPLWKRKRRWLLGKLLAFSFKLSLDGNISQAKRHLLMPLQVSQRSATQWEEGKHPLSWKMADLCPQIGNLSLYYTERVLYRSVQYYFRAPWLWINMLFLHRLFPGRLCNLRLDSRFLLPWAFIQTYRTKA